MPLDIFACVLALGVPAFVAFGLTIYVDRKHVQLSTTFSARLSGLLTRLERCESGLRKTSAAQVAVDVAALQGDVESLAKTVRKNFGRVWAEMHHDGVLDRAEKKQTDIETPEEVRERLRKEHGLPRIGGAARAVSEE